MADEPRRLANGADRIDFETHPSRYKHWKLTTDGEVATLTMDVSETGGLFEGYELKMNSYDLGVDIELSDAVQRLRFEHPAVKVVLLKSGKNRIFCAGANIRMLAGSTHAHKVNFCKFTNETRNGFEDSSENSGQKFLCVVNGTAAGGGYELALAADEIIMADDGSATVSLPEVPLLAVLPGTGGLTRVVDKRKVRRDRADVFCSTEEGVKGRRAVQWRLVDEVAPASRLEEKIKARAAKLAAGSHRKGAGATGVALTPLKRQFNTDGVTYEFVTVEIARAERRATITVRAPQAAAPQDVAAMEAQGVGFWPLQLARELDDAIVHLRLNELDIGLWVFKTAGDPATVLGYDAFLEANRDHWLVNEIRHFLKRVLKRIDVTSRTIAALVEPGSCFAGTLAELAFAADRTYMLVGQPKGDNRPEAKITLSSMNFGPYPMSHGLTRLESRLYGDKGAYEALMDKIDVALDGPDADDLGLVTYALDDIDWDDEIRLFFQERAAYSPDALTGMEANLRFVGPETMESKIFSRLTAWQNWIFQRPNAVGENGALRRYGSGVRGDYDMNRV